MRRRITLIHSDTEDVPVKEILTSRVEFKRPILGSLEEKFTFESPANPLVASIRILVRKSQQETQESRKLASVFSFTYPIGFHIYVEPRLDAGATKDEFFNEVNKQIQQVFDIHVPAGQWIQSFNSFYYHSNDIVGFKPTNESIVGDLWSAVDYYQADGATVVKYFKSDAELQLFDAQNNSEYAEIGIFSIDSHSTKDDVILSGVRIVLNDFSDLQDPATNPSEKESNVFPTMFHIKPRHRELDHQKADIKIIENGLHPLLAMDAIPKAPKDDDINECGLFAYFVLPKSVFLDRNQLPDDLSILAHYGTKDLELPEYSVEEWGTETLVQFTNSSILALNVTLHSRYQLPCLTSNVGHVTVDNAMLFYACDATSDSHLLSNSAFDNKREIGGSFERFFTDETIFYHLSDISTLSIPIPTLSADISSINGFTTLALIVGILMVLSSIWSKSRGQKQKKD